MSYATFTRIFSCKNGIKSELCINGAGKSMGQITEIEQKCKRNWYFWYLFPRIFLQLWPNSCIWMGDIELCLQLTLRFSLCFLVSEYLIVSPSAKRTVNRIQSFSRNQALLYLWGIKSTLKYCFVSLYYLRGCTWQNGKTSVVFFWWNCYLIFCQISFVTVVLVKYLSS